MSAFAIIGWLAVLALGGYLIALGLFLAWSIEFGRASAYPFGGPHGQGYIWATAIAALGAFILWVAISSGPISITIKAPPPVAIVKGA